ncbi:MAG: hypothetical protein KF861_02890 [Planctomycetaceae bacterium]|nr:hypothetical protein [Planctomycetaceae bacterium]
MTTMPVSRARLTAADNGPVISGEQVDFEVFAEVPNGVQLTPVTLNLKFNYRAADQTDIFGILLPALQPLVQFDESSFQIDYGLDVAGILFPVFDGVPTHSLAGTAVPTNWRIRDVRAVIGSLDLFIDLEPQSLSPSSGGEFSLLSMTLTGNTIETADVPEPSSITLFVVGLVTWIGYPLRRRVNCD